MLSILLAQAIAPPTPPSSLGITPNADGVGTVVDHQAGDYQIRGGTPSGNNLFHSFEFFQLKDGELANFLADPSTENIFGRINGGQISNIDGRLSVTGAGANLFLMNPSGLLFGPNAQLNLPAAFTATAGDGITFAGGQFNAFGANDFSQLLGNPDGFVFSTQTPGTITNQGNLSLTANQMLTLVGGRVESKGSLSAGQVRVVGTTGGSQLRFAQEGLTLTMDLGAGLGAGTTPGLEAQSLADLRIGDVAIGDVAVQEVEAGAAVLAAAQDLNLQESQLRTQGELRLQAGNSVVVRDSAARPFIAEAGGELLIQGDRNIDILALSHPDTQIESGSHLKLASDGPISGDAHFTSAGDIEFTTLAGEPGRFLSFEDPIIRSNGNVSFGDYTGAALKVEAQGSITAGNITITAPDSVDSIPRTDPDFVFLTERPSLILRAGADVTDPSALPTTEGISETEFSEGQPANTTADLTIGNITTAIADEFVDQFFFNSELAGAVILSATGSVTAGDINSTATGEFAFEGLEAGPVEITAGSTLQVGSIDASTTDDSSAFGRPALQRVQGGSVTLNAGGDLVFGSIDTRANANALSQGVSNGGDVSISAVGTVQGTGFVFDDVGGTTIVTQGSAQNSAQNGTIAIQHDGGPDNIAFQVGDAAQNGVAGELDAGTVTIANNNAFPTPGTVTQGADNEISITFNNTTPELEGGATFSTETDQALSFTVAELGLTESDVNNDNTTLEVAGITSGTLSREGVILSEGDAIAPDDTLTYTPPANFSGTDSFSLRSSDRVSVSPDRAIAIAVEQATPTPAPVPAPTPTPVPTPTPTPIPPPISTPTIPNFDDLNRVDRRYATASTVAGFSQTVEIFGERLASAPAVVELSSIRGILPEAPLLMQSPDTWQEVSVGQVAYFPPGNLPGNLGLEAPSFPSDGEMIFLISMPENSPDSFDPVLVGSLNDPTVTESEVNPPGSDVIEPGSISPEEIETTPSDAESTNSSSNSNGPSTLPPDNASEGPVSPEDASSTVDSADEPSTVDSTDTGDSTGTVDSTGTADSNSTAPGNAENTGDNTVAIAPPNSTVAPTTISQDCPRKVAELRQTQAAERKTGRYQALIQCYQKELAQATTEQNFKAQIYALNNLGVSHYVIGDYLKALAAHQEQFQKAQARGDRAQVGIALAGIGAAQAALGDYDRAITNYNQSLKALPDGVALPWRSLTLRNLGNAYLSKKDYPRAIQYQQDSLALSRSIQDRYGEMQALGNLGNAHSLNGEFEQAIAFYEQNLPLAQSLNAQLEKAQTLLGLGATHTFSKDYAKAIAYGQESLELLEELQNRLGQGVALTNLGDAHYKLQQFQPAVQSLNRAIETWESLRAGLGNNDAYKVSIFETQLSAYRNLQEVLAEQNQVGEALEIAERGRGRAFVELLARGNAVQSEAAAIAPPNLEQLRKIAREQNATVVEYTIAREQFVDVPHGSSLQYASEPQESKLLIWVLKPSGEVQLRQVDLLAWRSQSKTTLPQLVWMARQCMNNPGCARIAHRRYLRKQRGPEARGRSDIQTQPVKVPARNALAQLHQLLVEPVADLLPTDANERVIFVPQEQLFLVPFPALQNSDGQYLIDQHTITTAPALQLLEETRRRRQSLPASNPNALVVGNPAPMPGGFAPLPFTAAEAQEIGQSLTTEPLVGAAATEAKIQNLLPKARFIHLATHGTFNAQTPLDGAIALAPTNASDQTKDNAAAGPQPGGDRNPQNNPNDGFLTAREILDLSLSAELVVLSACDTGQGRITGDGVIGLSRSFLGAGASSVMVSLWQVPDDATAALMTEFYQQRQTAGRSDDRSGTASSDSPNNAQALRQAMLAIKQLYPNPESWAGFTLIGEVN